MYSIMTIQLLSDISPASTSAELMRFDRDPPFIHELNPRVGVDAHTSIDGQHQELHDLRVLNG